MTDTEAVRAIPEWAEKFRGESKCWDIASSVRPLIEEHIEKLLTTREAESYKQGQMNPKVGFLRQYLNEETISTGTWTDEQLLNLLRIPFTTNPKETL
jgi:hypothetical protein